MWIINICAFVVTALTLSVWFRKSFVCVVPVTFALWMILLQQLAYWGALSWIDPISAVLLLAGAAVLYKKRFAGLRTRANGIDILLLLFLCIVLLLLYGNTKLTDYDDFNYWAVSVKSLFYRGGIEGKYLNPASRFGDYPLGMQLIQWWFMHLTGQWQEPMLFVGLIVLTYSFLIPLLEGFRKPVFRIAFSAVVFLIPYCAYPFYHRLSPDMCMAAVYACTLVYCIRSAKEKDDTVFYSAAVALLCAVLVMLKSVGILWAAFVWIFWMILHGRKLPGKNLKKTVLLVVPAAVLWSQWQIVCKLLDRTTYLNDALLEAPFRLDGPHMERIQVFLRTLFLKSFRSIPIVPVGIPMAGWFMIMGVLLWLLVSKTSAMEKTERNLWKQTGLFLGFSTAVYFLVLLYSVVTMFFAEDQYQDPDLMMLLLQRYGSPLLVAVLALVIEAFAGYVSAANSANWGITACGSLCLLLIGLNIFPFLYQTKDRLGNVPFQEEPATAINQTISRYLDELSRLDRLNSKVLYCNTGEAEDSWVYLTIQYYSEGTAVVYTEGFEPERLEDYLSELHITHVFVESETEEIDTAYDHLMEDGAFRYNRMYQIHPDKTGVQLAPVTVSP